MDLPVPIAIIAYSFDRPPQNVKGRSRAQKEAMIKGEWVCLNWQSTGA